jgi:triosephosphate isomerase
MKIFLVGNWKLNPQSQRAAENLFNSINNRLKKSLDIFKKEKIIICPPFVYIAGLKKLFLKSDLKNFDFHFGAQNCFFQEKGAFTGEISAKMLKLLGVKFVILGHSERRRIFGETDEMINKKVLMALKEKLIPILCIGETEKERRSGKTFQVLNRQLKKGIENLSHHKNQRSNIFNIILAYEPVWAIGTKNPCDPESAKKVLLFLRKILTKTPILYGGSVNSENARDYIRAGFNGLLVGGASLRAKEFVEIAKKIY